MSTTVSNEYKTPAQMVDGSKTAGLSPAPAALVGTWKNTDSATRDIVKVVITQAGSGISVEAYGACTPTPCDWGKVSGLAYAANVSTNQSVAFSAQFKFSFAQVILAGHLQGKQLLVESFTHFTDGSAREDYYSADTMAK